jgi:hypothetical protein
MVTSSKDEEVITFIWLSNQIRDGTTPFYFGSWTKKNGVTLFFLPNMERSHSVLKNWNRVISSKMILQPNTPQDSRLIFHFPHRFQIPVLFSRCRPRRASRVRQILCRSRPASLFPAKDFSCRVLVAVQTVLYADRFSFSLLRFLVFDLPTGCLVLLVAWD